MSTNTLQEIERGIRTLRPPELYVWLDQHCPQPIDGQLKADLDAGHIDNRIDRALADYKAWTTQAF